jgi:hypothetical protein
VGRVTPDEKGEGLKKNLREVFTFVGWEGGK